MDQLQRENAELKREVGAQASMLTSRNREKDKLYQEIEDLKLSQMRGERMHSIAGDAYDGSMSRLRPRSGSRTSAETPVTVLSDVERSVYEQKLGQLRMEVSQLKLHNQELEKRLDDCLDEMEQAELLRTNREKEFELELELASREMRGVSRERDVLSAVKTDLEADFEKLKQEAQQEISQLEANVESQRTELRQVKRDLGNRHESFSALQNEMRLVSEVMIRLEDDQRARTRQLVDLRGGLQDAHAELAALERSLRDANAKIERYAVQQESSQSEIAFLREEQDTDKIKIGDLESALKETRKALQDQEELARALEARVRDERHEHETQTSKAKHEAQRAADQLNAQLSSVEDEAHRLRKSISSAEAEVREWHDRYHEFEGQLRETLGDRNNSATGLLRVSSLAYLTGGPLWTASVLTAFFLRSLRRSWSASSKKSSRSHRPNWRLPMVIWRTGSGSSDTATVCSRAPVSSHGSSRRCSRKSARGARQIDTTTSSLKSRPGRLSGRQPNKKAACWSSNRRGRPTADA